MQKKTTYLYKKNSMDNSFNKEVLRMQKLSGIISESEYNQKVKMLEEGWKDLVAGGMLAIASLLPNTADAQEDGVVEWDTVKDTVERISMDMDRDTLRIITTKAYEVYKDADGNIDKIVTDIKDEYTKYNSWDIDTSKTKQSSEIEKMNPETGEMVKLTDWGGKQRIYVDGSYRPTPEEAKEMYYDTGEISKEKFDSYVDTYNRWLSLFDKK